MEPGPLTPDPLFSGCLRHTHQVSTNKTSGHLMAHSTLVNRDCKYAYDISHAAIAATKKRLGDAAGRVRWLIGDITKAELRPAVYDVWHERRISFPDFCRRQERLRRPSGSLCKARRPCYRQRLRTGWANSLQRARRGSVQR